MESEIITTIADKGAIGVVILAVLSILWLVRTFLTHITEQAELSREAHRDMVNTSSGALREVSSVVAKLHESNEMAHKELLTTGVQVLSELREVKAKIK